MAITPYVTGTNKYYRRSRISEHQFRRVARYFARDLCATDTADLIGLTTKTVNNIYLKIRVRLAQECERESPFTPASGNRLSRAAKSKWTNFILVLAACAVSGVGAQREKHLCLVS